MFFWRAQPPLPRDRPHPQEGVQKGADSKNHVLRMRRLSKNLNQIQQSGSLRCRLAAPLAAPPPQCSRQQSAWPQPFLCSPLTTQTLGIVGQNRIGTIITAIAHTSSTPRSRALSKAAAPTPRSMHHSRSCVPPDAECGCEHRSSISTFRIKWRAQTLSRQVRQRRCHDAPLQFTFSDKFPPRKPASCVRGILTIPAQREVKRVQS